MNLIIGKIYYKLNHMRAFTYIFTIPFGQLEANSEFVSNSFYFEYYF